MPDDHSSPRHTRSVAVLSDATSIHEREVFKGVHRYHERADHWRVRLYRSQASWFADQLRGFDGDGVVTPIYDKEMPAMAAEGGWRVVYATHVPRCGGLSVALDHEAVGAAAVTHLAEQGLGHVVMFHVEHDDLHGLRCRGALGEAERRGVEVTTFFEGPRTLERGKWRMDDQLRDVADLLGTLGMPVGFFAYNDTHAERALAACRLAGLRVPVDVAVVCASDDAEFCGMTDPPLSHIGWDGWRIGFEACRLLDTLMDGQPPPDRPTLIAPRPVVVQASSDLMSLRDPLVTRAIGAIQEGLHEHLTVERLLRDLPVSRNTLDKRFKAVVGHSAAEHIRQTRLDEARRLLRVTHRSLIEIAVDCGYSDAAHLSREVKRATGKTPIQYRRAHAVGGVMGREA